MQFSVFCANLSLEHPKRSAENWHHVIKNSGKFDIIALQECLNFDKSNLGEQIKELLCANCVDGDAYLSFPQPDLLGINEFFGDQTLLVCEKFANKYIKSRKLAIKSVHLDSTAYIPQLLIDGLLNRDTIYEFGRNSRQLELDICLDEAQTAEHAIVMGDFNEPSHFDITATGESFEFYCSTEMQRRGFRDAVFKMVGKTESLATYPYQLYNDSKQRLDFIYYRGKNLECLSCQYVDSEISDHLAIVATFSFQ